MDAGASITRGKRAAHCDVTDERLEGADVVAERGGRPGLGMMSSGPTA